MESLPILVAGELLPDHPERDNPGVLRAENVVPGTNCYLPVRGLIADRSALDDVCLGAGPVADDQGVVENFAGDNDGLYILDGTGAYVAATGTTIPNMTNKYPWTFIGFNGYRFAIGGYTEVQVYDEVSAFEDITPNPAGTLDDAPEPLYGAVVRNFIMTGNQTLNDHEVVWSGLNDHTMWVDPGGDVSIANQAGRQILQDGGPITQVVGGEYGVIFCEHAIYRANYEGYPLVFSFSNVAPGRGTLYPGSVAQYGHTIYYIDIDGFYVFDGTGATPLGSNKLNRWFLDDINIEYPFAVNSLVDVANTMVYWAYPSKEATIAGVCDKMMVYNWATDQFAGPIHLSTERLVYSLTPGVEVDDYTTETVDDAAFSDKYVDSQEYKGGGRPVVAAFDDSHQYAITTGDVLEGLIETGDYAMHQNGYTLLDAVRPVVEGESPDVTIAVGTRNNTWGDPSWTADISPYERTQLCHVRENARYHRMRMKISGKYDKAVGFEPVAVATGMV